MLQSKSWRYPMKSTTVIIGRAPKETPFDPNDNKIYKWHVDLALNSSIKIARQQAFIAYNFFTSTFEIKNLSTKHEILLNGNPLNGDSDPVALKDSDTVQIGTEEFMFLLPVTADPEPKTGENPEEESKIDTDALMTTEIC